MSKATENKSIGIAFASLVMTIFSFGYGVLHDHSVKKSSDTRFASIEASLRLLTGTVAPQLQKAIDDSLASAISISTNDARDKIAFAGSAIQQLNNAQTWLPTDAIRRTGDQLNAVAQLHTNLPETWATIGDFISYRSKVVSRSPDQTKKLTTESLPNCTDSFPKPMRITEVLGPHEATQSRGIYENSRVMLDSPRDDQRLNAILSGQTPLITFKNCLVVYRGGQIDLILAWDKAPYTFRLGDDSTRIFHTTITGATIEFENCLFDFSLQGAPPYRGQQISAILLAQDTSTVSFPAAN